MTDNNHPITPSLELVDHWDSECESDVDAAMYLATQAARWGADVELEACKEWVANTCPLGTAKNLHDTRRPKPPSLKEQALETVQRLSKNGFPCNYQDDADWDTIRRALEQLHD